MTGKIDIVGEGAKRKFGLPAEWVIFRWEAKNGFFVLTGAVCTETHKVGKRNGHLNWAKLDKATEGLEDQGPLSVMGILVNNLF